MFYFVVLSIHLELDAYKKLLLRDLRECSLEKYTGLFMPLILVRYDLRPLEARGEVIIPLFAFGKEDFIGKTPAFHFGFFL